MTPTDLSAKSVAPTVGVEDKTLPLFLQVGLWIVGHAEDMASSGLIHHLENRLGVKRRWPLTQIKRRRIESNHIMSDQEEKIWRQEDALKDADKLYQTALEYAESHQNREKLLRLCDCYAESRERLTVASSSKV